MNAAAWLWWGILAGLGLPAAFWGGAIWAERRMARADAEPDPAALPERAESLRSRPTPGRGRGLFEPDENGVEARPSMFRG